MTEVPPLKVVLREDTGYRGRGWNTWARLVLIFNQAKQSIILTQPRELHVIRSFGSKSKSGFLHLKYYVCHCSNIKKAASCAVDRRGDPAIELNASLVVAGNGANSSAQCWCPCSYCSRIDNSSTKNYPGIPRSVKTRSVERVYAGAERERSGAWEWSQGSS